MVDSDWSMIVRDKRKCDSSSTNVDGNIGGFIFGTAVSFSVESVSGSFLGAGLRRAFFVSVPNFRS